MCAIVDANVVHEVFGSNRPQAGVKFLEWLDAGKGLLVVGGKPLRELRDSSEGFRSWALQAQLAGRMRIENEHKVNAKAVALLAEGRCRSNDQYILGLAQVSGARLLYSNDRILQQDFKDNRIINSPRGRVYSTLKNKDFESGHKRLLSRHDLCGAGR